MSSVDVVKLKQEVTELEAAVRELQGYLPLFKAFKTAAEASFKPQPQQPQQQQQPPQQRTPRTVSQIMDRYPSELRCLLTFEQQGGKAVLRLPKKVDVSIFKQIAAQAKQLGGEYSSAGANTRFEIPL